MEPEYDFVDYSCWGGGWARIILAASLPIIVFSMSTCMVKDSEHRHQKEVEIHRIDAQLELDKLKLEHENKTYERKKRDWEE